MLAGAGFASDEGAVEPPASFDAVSFEDEVLAPVDEAEADDVEDDE